MAQQTHFSVAEVAQPSVEPVGIEYVKSWLRLDDDGFDAQLDLLIKAARRLCCNYTGRAFVNQQFVMKMDRVPLLPNTQYAPGNPNTIAPVIQNNWPLDPSVWAIRMPRSPLVSVDSFTYIDGQGATQTLASDQYLVDNTSEPGRLSPSLNAYWPGVQWRPNSVSITFTAGYGATADKVPEYFRHAICMTVGHLFDNPNGAPGQGALPDAVKAILQSDPVAEEW